MHAKNSAQIRAKIKKGGSKLPENRGQLFLEISMQMDCLNE